MTGAQSAEIPSLHAAREALADRSAGHINILTGHEVIGGDFRTNRDQFVFLDAKLGELALRLHLRNGKMPALSLADVADLARARTKLDSDVAVLVLGAVADDLAIAKPKHRHRDV